MGRSSKFKAVGLLVLLLVLGAAVVVAQASGVFVSVQNPEEMTSHSAGPVPPLLAPPGSEGYEQIVDVSISAPDDRPVAYLAERPKGLTQSMEANFPDINDWSSSDSVEFFVLASVHYSGSGHTVLVTTAKPSPEAAKQSWVLGNETVQLADRSSAWLSTNQPGEMPNRLVILRDDLIITVASDLPIETVRELAYQVVVEQKH